MKRLLILLPALFLLGGCAGQKPEKRSIESISANTGAAMSSYPTASSVVAGDKALISKSTASNATQQAAMSTIKDYVLSDVIDFSATSPLSFNSTTGVLSLTPWESQSALETWLGWTFSGGGGGITVSSALPTTAGSAALNDSTHILTVASDTGYTQFTGNYTAWDTTPAAFGFGSITDAVAGQEYCWTTPATVAGINKATTVASTADSYKINGTTSNATSIALGDTFTPCMIASSTAGATVSGNMTVGGVVGDPVFSVTTASTVGCVGTYGSSTQGATALAFASNYRILISRIAICDGGTVATMGAWLQSISTSSRQVIYVVYDDNNGEPGDLLWYSSPFWDANTSTVTNKSIGVNQAFSGSHVWIGVYDQFAGSVYALESAGGTTRYINVVDFSTTSIPPMWPVATDTHGTTLPSFYISY